MMNEFESRWTSVSSGGHAAGRFRVYPDHPLDFYVQYSLAGLREVVIEVISENLPPFELPAFRNIDLVKLPIAGGVRIGMTLLDGDLSRNFSVMCYDLAERSRVAEKVEIAAGIFLRALENWAELFKKRAHDGLTREQVVGLIGELLVLEALLDEARVSPDALIQGWRGPDGDDRDIGFNGTRIEVKAQRSTGSLRLRISSLSQLDDRGDRVFVVLNRLSPADSGRSLLEIVEALKVRLEAQQLASLEFERKIALSGMSPDSPFIYERYSLDDRLVYSVREGFPRLTPANVPPGIDMATYEIAGPPLEAYRTTWFALIGSVYG